MPGWCCCDRAVYNTRPSVSHSSNSHSQEDIRRPHRDRMPHHMALSTHGKSLGGFAVIGEHSWRQLVQRWQSHHKQAQLQVPVRPQGAGARQGQRTKLGVVFFSDIAQRLNVRLSPDLSTPRGIYTASSIFERCNCKYFTQLVFMIWELAGLAYLLPC